MYHNVTIIILYFEDMVKQITWYISKRVFRLLYYCTIRNVIKLMINVSNTRIDIGLIVNSSTCLPSLFMHVHSLFSSALSNSASVTFSLSLVPNPEKSYPSIFTKTKWLSQDVTLISPLTDNPLAGLSWR